MTIFKCDRCGEEIRKKSDNPVELDNTIPGMPLNEEDHEYRYEITRDSFNWAGMWTHNKDIHLCKDCMEKLEDFLDELGRYDR